MIREAKKKTQALLSATLELQEYNKMYKGARVVPYINAPIGEKSLAQVNEFYFYIEVRKDEEGYVIYWKRNNVKA